MLPSELLIIVFSNLDLDSVDNARNTCKKWNNLIKTSVHLWKSLINQYCASSKSKQEMLKMQMYKGIQKSADKLEQFYRKLVKIEENFLSNNYRVRTLNCLDAEFEGKKVVRSSEWEQNHNYKGVYDMILNKNRLVASVYDTIQVWDMSSYQVANILPSKVLDEPHCATTCFTLLDDTFLICGTQNGFLKLFEIPSGKFLTQVKKNSNYISDVNASGNILSSVDWYGEITLWKLTSSNKLENITEENKFQVPLILAGRENERLLDFTSEFLVSTFRCHLTCYRYGEFFRSYPAPSDIFCIGIHGDKLAFGCKGNRDSPAAGILKLGWDRVPQVVYIKTRDNDPVISLSFNEKFLILGDTNGELHIVDVQKIVFPDNGEVTVELGKESDHHGLVFVGTIRTHEYRAFIWACKTDPYRIFSGDETGKIIIHDYLMFED